MALFTFAGCGGNTEKTSKSEPISETTTEDATVDTDTEVSETLQKLRKKGYITIAGSGTAPFGFIDAETNELKGIDLEISMAVAKKLGIKDVKYVTASFDSLIPELQGGKCDVISSAMYITEERQEIINFSNVYYTEGEGILCYEDDGYESLEDMKGAVCAIQQGSGYIKVAEQYVEEGIFSRIDTYPSIDETVLALRSKKADVAMADNVALAYMNSHEENQKLGTVLFSPYEMQYAGKIGAGFLKDDPAFVAEWNTALTELKEDGTVLEIMKKYGLDESFYVEVGEDVIVNPE